MKTQENLCSYKRIAIYALCFIVFTMTVSGGCIHGCADEPGTFGDMFGFVNALFSGLAFVGMIITLLMQREELELQREEMKQTRDEIKMQRKVSEIQRFENTFFNMLHSQQQILNDLRFDLGDVQQLGSQTNDGIEYHPTYIPCEKKGREFFEYVYYNYRMDFSSSNKGTYNYLTFYGIKKYWANYSFLYSHYFQHMYTILRYIDETSVFKESEGDESSNEFQSKYQYARILRSTLSPIELIFLYYNGLTPFGAKMKPLIEKYCMLNNININGLSFSTESLVQLNSKWPLKVASFNKEISEYLRLDPYDESKQVEYECNIIEKINNIREEIMRNSFSGGDYEFHITGEKNIADKYHISAFGYTEEEKEILTKKIKEFWVWLGKDI